MSRPFKVGDLVMCLTDSVWRHYGTFIGVVDKIEDSRDPFCYNNMRIVLQNGYTCWWSEKHTTLATELIKELV